MRKAKGTALLLSVLASALMLLAWSQTWFSFASVFSTEESPVLDVSGQVVAPGLSALALAGFAITAALSLAGLLVRRILGGVLVAVGVIATVISIVTVAAPLSSSASALTALSGISNISELVTIVTAESITFWPICGIVSGLLLSAAGIVVLFTAGSWARAGRKFETPEVLTATSHNEVSYSDSTQDVNGKNVDTWDSLSRGSDPTTN